MKYAVVKLQAPDSVATGKSGTVLVSRVMGVFEDRRNAEAYIRESMLYDEEDITLIEHFTFTKPKQKGDRLLYTHKYVVMPVVEVGDKF